MSTLSITFTSNYAGGAYIIYYKLSTAVSYTSFPFTCSTTVPSPCTVNIPIPTLSNDSCDDVTYEGYIEPACCAGNPACQETFTVTFTPTEPCQAVTFECTAGGGCDGFNAGTNCDGNPYGLQDNTVLNQTVTICYTGGLAGVPGGIPGTYTQTLNTTVCCYDCQTIEFRNTTGGPIDIQYIDCTNIFQTEVGIAAGAVFSFCARPLSYTSIGDVGTFTITSPTCP